MASVNDLDRMERFWSAVLGVDAVREDGVSALHLPSGLELLLLPVPEPKTVKDRLHLDLSPVGCDQARSSSGCSRSGRPVSTSARAR